MKLHNTLIFLGVMLLTLLTNCADDLIYETLPGEGEATLSFDMHFVPVRPALDGTRTPGNTVRRIENVSVVVYKKNGELYKVFRSSDKDPDNQLIDFRVDATSNSAISPDRPNGTESNGEKTDIAYFKIKDFPYGQYYFYAVANLDFTDAQAATPTALKAITVPWNNDVAKDNAMFGYFRDNESGPTTGFEAPLVTVSRVNVNLSSWIRRLVSKVTIAYDPSGLKEAVTIYIKSVTIRDIPASCKLGEVNKPDNPDQLIKDGETIYYGDATAESDYESREGWLKLQKGSGLKGQTQHTNTDNALFFYENMQGNYADDPNKKDYQKPQLADEVGTSINEPIDNNDYKDRVLCGTYIEVDAYYRSSNPEKVSEGPIKYRFMLGKDTEYDYNAERNHHYKLTLKFRGWANEPDWHIVYDEPELALLVPSPYYISFLYKQDMSLPIRLRIPEEERQNYRLHSQIIENNWAPYDSINGLPPANQGAADDPLGMSWNKYAYEHVYAPYSGTSTDPAVRENGNYVGFLSVRQTQETILGNTMGYGPEANDALKDYYLGNPPLKEGWKQVTPRYWAEYNLGRDGTFNILDNDEDGEYKVSTDLKDNSITVNVPMYTRAKQMVPATDFTGTNPFDTYQRKAVVRFTLLDKNNNEVEFSYIDDAGKEIRTTYRDITIYQVRRIVNPKAIWRKANSTEEFHVQLMHLDGATDNTFSAFESQGAWRATILTDPKGLITLRGNGQTAIGEGQSIEGSTGTHIDFTYKPSSTIGANETRSGIILVEYHNYTCHHLIHVRQGYDAGVELGGKMWSCYNAVAAEGGMTNNTPTYAAEPDRTSTNVVVTESPLSIGSYFKRCQYNYAIMEKNDEHYGWLKSVTGVNLTTAIADKSLSKYYKETSAKWSDIGGLAWNNGNTSYENKSWAETWTALNRKKVNGQNVELTLPTLEDFRRLRDECEYGYGVIYADGAGEVATNVTDAYGFSDYENTASGSPRGVRCCVVYNPNNGDHIIFPLGATGQARRARTLWASNYNSTTNSNQLSSNISDPQAGAISYSGAYGLLYAGNKSDKYPEGNNNYRPLTYNIYRETGGLYWIKTPGIRDFVTGGSAQETMVTTWDINYYTVMFNPYDEGSLASGNGITNTNCSDAVPIKFIYK